MLVGGYDPAQVRAAIDERDERLRLLEREAQKLATRVIQTEKRLQRILPGSGEDGVIGGLGRRIEDIHAQARGQATRIRMAALEDAVQISERVRELAKVRDELGQRVSELAGMAGIKLGGEERPPVGTEPAQASADGVFAGPVEVEVGPLRDFAQLTNFEDAASGIDSVEDVKVRRFADGRATFSMNFGSRSSCCASSRSARRSSSRCETREATASCSTWTPSRRTATRTARRSGARVTPSASYLFLFLRHLPFFSFRPFLHFFFGGAGGAGAVTAVGTTTGVGCGWMIDCPGTFARAVMPPAP